MYRIGIDVGGTFTDLVAVDESGTSTFAKSPSTPADPSIGVLEGLAVLAEALGLDRPGLLGHTQRIVHGTTVATNALLERKGARVGLLTTEGHRDVLEMREGLKPEDRYNLRLPAPEPLVPRHLRLGVRERIKADGSVLVPLDEASLAGAIDALQAAGVNAVAICFLHAWRNSAHEQAAVRMVRERMPGAYVTASADVYPQIKEYERVSTTVVNAYVGPVVAGYLGRLDTRLQEAGYQGPLFIMLSHGGVAPVGEAVRIAAATALSGPAGGVAGSRYAAALLDTPNLIPFDMGGTSTDISLIRNSEPGLAIDRGIAGQRIALPSLDIVTLGAGGGSIAEVDTGGVLHVGPESAGADPGPACYGRGGTRATVTDANLLLGLLEPSGLLGGRMRLDRSASDRALSALGARLGLDAVGAAAGVQRVINARMAEGIRLVSVRRGIDPSAFALLAFGGAAGLHASAVARQLSIRRVVVPRVASVLSAWGMLASDIRFETTRSHIGDTAAMTSEGLAGIFGAMERDARQRLAAVFDGEVAIARSADMRYGEQIFEINVPLDGLDFASPALARDVAEAFHARHEELYTYAQRSNEVVLVNARVAAIGKLPALPREPNLGRREPASPLRRQRVYLGAWTEVPVYAFDALASGQEIAGPALVESATTTALVEAGDRARATANGWLDIDLLQAVDGAGRRQGGRTTG
ncbi:MAG: hydantoinase/oxoprolinase family protein [Hyphomicrobiaceae bacterium]|nr:hydantoinase/oxoprolinase family protein [Hyphomicrobiaceae bacterium]